MSDHTSATPGQPAAAAASAPAPDAARERPTLALPTNRIGFPNQLNILRGFASHFEQHSAPATLADVGTLVQLHPNTVGLITPFFVESGLLERSQSGFTPNGDTMAYLRASGWDAVTAPTKLAPTLRRTWFAGMLLPRLRVSPIEERDALRDLGIRARASQRYESQLRFLLDYLAAAGLLRRDGSMLRDAGGAPAADTEEDARPDIIPAGGGDQSRQNGGGGSRQDANGGGGGAGTGGGGGRASGNSVQFNVEVHVDMAEVATWAPDRITAFFAGIAQVIAAKGQLDQSQGGR